MRRKSFHTQQDLHLTPLLDAERIPFGAPLRGQQLNVALPKTQHELPVAYPPPALLGPLRQLSWQLVTCRIVLVIYSTYGESPSDPAKFQIRIHLLA